MSNEIKGTIDKILEVQSGQTKNGDEWKKVSFVVKNNEGYEGREQIFCFDIFGADKVDNFLKYNAVGNLVNVKYEIRTNEFKDKYYTNLQAWRVESGEAVEQASSPKGQPIDTNGGVDEPDSDLPF